jgi:TonB-linked SusC/RagA family outer membrane protein
MKIHLQNFIIRAALLVLIFSSTAASAQITASLLRQGPASQSAKTLERSKDNTKSQRPLKGFLSAVEKTFHVHFTFESSVVKDKKIGDDVEIQNSLEETLKNALHPLKLRYYKVSDKYYTIFKAEDSHKYEKKSNNTSDNVGDTVSQVEPQHVNQSATVSVLAAIQITGKVIDEAGAGMPGVNVVEKGTSNGTVTDNVGRYSLNVTDENSVLVISFVGYRNAEEVVGSRTEITTQLNPDVQTLTEVVVVGYSTQERKNVTAAVSTINPEQLENRPVTNMYQALQGLAPNLIIQQNVAEPGSVQTLNIRGVGSFTDNSPLIIVDGVNVGSLGLNYLNPNDVESITVLKDAASSAIYGSQAANGVIYVVTKSGQRNEQMSIQYNGMFGLQSPTTTPKAVEGWEFMTLKNEALNNSNLPPQFAPQQIADQRAAGSYPWAYDEFVNNVVPQQNQNLSITGGSKNTSYLLSAGYMNQQSMFNGDYIPRDKRFYYKRYNLRTNISTQLNKVIKTDLNVAYTHGVNRNHPFSTGIMVRDAMRTPRIYPIVDEAGNFVVPPLTSNSVFAQLSKGGFKSTQSNNLLGVLNVTVTPIENLRLNVNTSANYSFYNEELQVREFTYAPQYTTAAPPQFNEQRKSNWSDLTRTFFATLEYERNFGDHNGKVLVGYRSDYVSNYSFVSAYRVNGTVLDDDYIIGGDFTRDQNGNITGNITNYNGITNPERKTINSVFGRVNYAFRDKYLAEFTWRYDGASVLAPDNRWFFFPAVSLGWRVTDENFLKPFRDAVGEVKLRYSIGQVGNSNIGGFNYLSRVIYDPPDDQFYQAQYSFNNTATQGVLFSPVNPELEWERSTMANYGIDVNLFNNSLSLSFDYFNKDTDGIYFTPSVPGTLGLSSPIQNFAEVKNVGWEFMLNWRTTTGNINHTVGFNVADNTNKVIRVGEEQILGSDFNYIIKEGFPISSYYLYKSDGLYQNLDDLENAPSVPFAYNQRVNPGDIRYIDKNSDGVIDGNDRYILGNPFPRFTFGFNYSGTWKNFDFQMLWQGVGKRVQYLRGDIVEAFHNNEEHAFVQHKDRWTPTNPDATYPRLTASTSTNSNNTAYSDYWLFDTKYLRLKNLQIGYSLPESWISKAGIQSLRIYFSAQNLVTFSPKRFRKIGIDAEFTQFDNKLNFSNYDPIAGRNYPNAKVLAAGIDIKF